MLKIVFYVLGVIGVVIISILAFVLPSDHYMIIPAMSVMSFDKPLWFAIIVSGSFIYLCLLYELYDYLEEQCINKRKRCFNEI